MQVRALMDRICEEAEETDPNATGAQAAATLASRKVTPLSTIRSGDHITNNTTTPYT